MTALHTASFYRPEHWVGRCYRVSRRHPRGLRVQWDTLRFFWPELHLFRAYRAGEVDFEGLSQQYLGDLNDLLADEGELKRWLEELPAIDELTLLCFEPEGEPCHRRVLARWLAETGPAAVLGELR